MGKTYRDKWKNKIKNPPLLTRDSILFTTSLKSEAPELVAWNKFWDSVPYEYNCHYDKNPSWYNRLMSTRPKRRLEQRLERQATTLPPESIEQLDELVWPLARKPKWWFW